MVADKKRREVAEQILKYGWIEATPENIKAYLDGFEMAGRGEYEESDISVEEYMERLANHPTYPIHIVTKKQMAEAAIDRDITADDIAQAVALIQSLDKDKDRSH